MEPFIGQIGIFPYSFAPRGWMYCQGQILSIAQNTALFSILGTTYGGNGQTTFALPNLNGRAPVHQGTLQGGNNYSLGEAAGLSSVTLNTSQLPAHTHSISAAAAVGNADNPSSGVLAQSSIRSDLYTAAANTTMAPAAVAAAGGTQPHNNLPPYLALGFFIAVSGTFPARN
jgi:microcystin-dependent protein